MEFKELSKQYWGKHFLQVWVCFAARAIGYGVWSTGNVTQEIVDEYLEHHRKPSNKDRGTMFLE